MINMPRERGLGLLEMLVALSIMALSLTLIYRSVGGSIRGANQVENVNGAVQLGHSLLDGLDVIGPSETYQSGQHGIYSWHITSALWPNSKATVANVYVPMFRVTITISWGEQQWVLETLRPQRPRADRQGQL